MEPSRRTPPRAPRHTSPIGPKSAPPASQESPWGQLRAPPARPTGEILPAWFEALLAATPPRPLHPVPSRERAPPGAIAPEHWFPPGGRCNSKRAPRSDSRSISRRAPT